MSFLDLIGMLVILFGHLAVWCMAYNQMHATGWPRLTRKIVEKLIFVMVLAGGLILIANRLRPFLPPFDLVIALYQWTCYAAAAWMATRWVFRKLTEPAIPEVLSEETRRLDVAEQLEGPGYRGWQARLLSWIPGNQSLKLSIEHREFLLKGFPDDLDGLVIAHLSDLHFNGKISRGYFEQVFDLCNREQPDLVFLTGDVLDQAKCLDWLPATLGRLSSRHGKYYVLGNHDLRIRDQRLLREAIEATGFQPARPEWCQIELGGSAIFLAGNELPWYTGAEQLVAHAPQPSIMLSHSPDQVFRAANLGVDLMLAGHCHGGQVRLPLIGPLIAPSRYGIRFASGTFRIGNTLMHVTRGLSGDDPIRWNCPPELNLITIRTSR